MSKNGLGSYSLGVFLLFVIMSSTVPAFAEVTNLETNSDSFFRGDKIKFSGNVEDGSQGLVTIAINSANDEELVMISQALINSDNSFEKTIKIGDKFTKHGIHDATAFILNMTKGSTTEFEISLNGTFIKMNDTQNNFDEESSFDTLFEDEISQNDIYFDDSTSNSAIIGFVDPSKGAQYYIDRYYTEPTYQSWFDRNYPGMTIEQAVGLIENTEINSSVQDLIKREIIPEAEASPIAEPIREEKNNSDIAQVSLAVAGLGILFGAVYGIKRKVDDNSRQISLNRETIRKKLIRPIIGSKPKEILQTRLAKGEITLEEYEKLDAKLS